MTRSDGVRPQLRAHWRPVGLILLAQAPAVVFYTTQPLLLKVLVDSAIARGDGTLAALLIGGMVALLVLHAVGDLAKHTVAARAAANVAGELRARMFAQLGSLSASFHTRARSGDL